MQGAGKESAPQSKPGDGIAGSEPGMEVCGRSN